MRVDAAEVSQKIQKGSEKKEKKQSSDDLFRTRTALLIAGMALLLAITSLGKSDMSEAIINNNIKASDTWAFYQAKNTRQSIYNVGKDIFYVQLKTSRINSSPLIKKMVEDRILKYEATISRYNDEPDPSDPDNPLKGEGKKQLLQQARRYEEERDLAMKKSPYFAYAEIFFQISIVIASIGILTLSRVVVGFSCLISTGAILFMLNGFFLFF